MRLCNPLGFSPGLAAEGRTRGVAGSAKPEPEEEGQGIPEEEEEAEDAAARWDASRAITLDLEIRGLRVNVRCLVTVGFPASDPTPASAMVTSLSPSASSFFGDSTGIPEMPFTTRGLLNIFPGIVFWFCGDLADHSGIAEPGRAEEDRGDVTALRLGIPCTFGLLVIVPSKEDFLCPIGEVASTAGEAFEEEVAAAVSNFFVLANELAVGANNLDPAVIIEPVRECVFVPILPTPPFEAVDNLVPIDDTPPPELELVAALTRETLEPPLTELILVDDVLLAAVSGLLNDEGIGDLDLAVEDVCGCATERRLFVDPFAIDVVVVGVAAAEDLVGMNPGVAPFFFKGLDLSFAVSDWLEEAAVVVFLWTPLVAGAGCAVFPRFQTLATRFLAEVKNPKRVGLGLGAKKAQNRTSVLLRQKIGDERKKEIGYRGGLTDRTAYAAHPGGPPISRGSSNSSSGRAPPLHSTHL